MRWMLLIVGLWALFYIDVTQNQARLIRSATQISTGVARSLGWI